MATMLTTVHRDCEHMQGHYPFHASVYTLYVRLQHETDLKGLLEPKTLVGQRHVSDKL